MVNNQVPTLQLSDGSKIGQAESILRFLGKEHGYYPEDPVEAHKVDYLIDSFYDKFVGLAVNSVLPSPLLEFEFSLVFNDAIPDFLDFLEPYLKEGKFICGDKLTTADFVIGGFYTNMITNERDIALLGDRYWKRESLPVALFTKFTLGTKKWENFMKNYPNF